MVSARERIEALGKGGARLLERMVHLDPSRRCTMFDALTSPVFACLRESGDYRGGHLGNSSEQQVQFMHYYHADGTQSLPIL